MTRTDWEKLKSLPLECEIKHDTFTLKSKDNNNNNKNQKLKY